MTAIVALCPTPILQFFDNSGNPAAGGSVLTQVGGVNYATYQDSAGTTALPNPIPLNSRGEISNAAGASCQLFLVVDSVYTFTISDVNGNQLNQAIYVSPLPPTSIAVVASAATGADIWSPGNVISWTGTATTTAFAAAPTAGSRRLLIPNGACKFTAGANLLIRGFPSGATATMNANAFVTVTALTTTQFLLEYSLSGSFTASGTGFSAAPTNTLYYTVVNGAVTISSNQVLGMSTSNATTFTITGFPAELVPSAATVLAPLTGLDNNRTYLSTVYGILSGSTLTLYSTPVTGVWTASNTTKGLLTGTLSYLISV